MTSTSQLVTAASAADWSSFKSLLVSATPADIAAIGSDWDTVMDAIGAGVSSSATPAAKGLFTTAMTQFFTDAGTYVTGDHVVAALISIAMNSQFSGVDHLSVELVSILNTVPASVAATVSTGGFGPLSDLLSAVTGNDSNPEVTPAELNRAFTALADKFGPALDANAILVNAGELANYDAQNGGDHLAAVRTLLAIIPDNLPTAFINPGDTLERIVSNAQNPNVTATELNSTLKAFIATYAAYTDSTTFLNTALEIVQGDVNTGADHLASVRTLLSATAADTPTDVPTFLADSLLSGIAEMANTPGITAAEITSTLNAYLSHYGSATDVSIILNTAFVLVEQDNDAGTDHMGAVRALLNATPSPSFPADTYLIGQLIEAIGISVSNAAITPAELHSTLNAFLSHYSTQTNSFDILNAATIILDSDNASTANHMDSVRALFNATPAGGFVADTYITAAVMQDIGLSVYNTAITPAEIHSTLNAFLSHYSTQTNALDIFNTAIIFVEADNASGTNHMDSVRALFSAMPASGSEADSFEITQLLTDMAESANNSAVTADELNLTFKSFVNHYGASTGVDDILNTACILADSDSTNGTDHFSAVRTLLGAQPANADMASTYLVNLLLEDINENNQNGAISEHELAQTLSKFTAAYGAQADSLNLASAIIIDADVEKFEAAGAIVNHLAASQHADVATAVNAGSSAELLTTGHDTFDGSSSDKLAVYGAAGRDVIDFSGNTETTGRYLDGGAGADTLIGGLGDDILAGGAGANTLTGGAGADTFRFDHANGTLDHVTDFNAAQGDIIDLQNVLHTEGSINISDYVSLQTVGSNTIVSVDVDGTGGAHNFVQVAELDNTTGLDLNALYAQGQIIT